MIVERRRRLECEAFLHACWYARTTKPRPFLLAHDSAVFQNSELKFEICEIWQVPHAGNFESVSMLSP